MDDSNPTVPAWERVAHHSHLYVLPVAGGASLVLGTLATIGMGGELPRLLPFALIVVGTCSLLGSLASHLCIPRVKGVEHPEPTAPPASEAAGAPRAVRTATAGGDAPAPSPLRPHSGIGRATLAELSHVEDELWRRWATPRGVPLGAPLAGPVPETAYSPAQPGAYAPFADRDRDIVVLTDTHPSRASASSSKPRVPASPTRAGVSKRVTSPRVPTAPRADIAPSARPAPSPNETLGARGFAGASIPLLSGRSSDLFDMDAIDHPTYLSSINPILPRPGATAGGEGRSVPKTRPTVHGGICSECSRRLLDFRAWVECRACRKPMCRDCLQQSFSTGEGGSCSECRGSRRGPTADRPRDRRENDPAARWIRSREASLNASGVRVSRARPGPT